jgi:hypothetical protein
MIISILNNNKILIKTNEIDYGKTDILQFTKEKRGITLISACYLFGSSGKTFDNKTILFYNGNVTFDRLLLISEQSIKISMTATLRQPSIRIKIFPSSKYQEIGGP